MAMSPTIKAAWITGILGIGGAIAGAIITLDPFAEEKVPNTNIISEENSGITIQNSENVVINQQVPNPNEQSFKEAIKFFRSRGKDVIKQIDTEIKELESIHLKISKAFPNQINKEFLGNDFSSFPLEQAGKGQPEKVTSGLLEKLGIVIDKMESLKKQFLDLHEEHLEALKNNEHIYSLEVYRRITKLLLSGHRTIFHDGGFVEVDTDRVYYQGWEGIKIGDHKANSVSGRVELFYPSGSFYKELE